MTDKTKIIRKLRYNMPNKKRKEEKKKAAKDLVNLSHVEIKKQYVNYKGMLDILSTKQKYDEQQEFRTKLTNDELAILTAFQKKRMLLDRIWIIVNQSRIQMEMEGFKREVLKDKLDYLVKLGYLKYEAIEYESKINDVYILTDLGSEQVF